MHVQNNEREDQTKQMRFSIHQVVSLHDMKLKRGAERERERFVCMSDFVFWSSKVVYSK